MNLKKIVKVLKENFSKYISPALFAMILAAVISGILLFVPPIHGYADNGDFYQAMTTNGIYRLGHGSISNYVITKFGIYQYFNGNGINGFSSQSIFIQIALLLNKIFYSSKFFDIRFLGIVYYAFYLGAIYMLTKALVYPYKALKSYAIALVVVVMFTDSSFMLYFNSFFVQPVMIISLIYGFSSILLLGRQVYKKNWPLITLFFVSVMILITSEAQNALLALSFSIVAIGLMFLPHFKTRRFAVALGMLALICSGVFTYTTMNNEREVDRYQSFTHGVLMDAGDPTRKIKKEGVNEQFALLQSQDYYPQTYTAVEPQGKMIKTHLLSNDGIIWKLKYFSHNTKQFGQLINFASQGIMFTQVRSVGNYVPSSNKPKGQVRYFTIYSQLMGDLFPSKYAFLVLLIVGLVSCYGVGLYLDYKSKQSLGVMRFFLVLGLSTIVLFVPVNTILNYGVINISAHIFMVPLSLDLMFILFISDALHDRLWNTEVKEGSLDHAK